MVSKEFQLNNLFEENAKVYQTKPVRATKYQPGMETGFAVYFYSKDKENFSYLHEGLKFFDTEKEAWDYINADHKQYAEENGVLMEIPVIYDSPIPVLHRKETDSKKKVGFVNFIECEYAFISDETEMYDFFILASNHNAPDTWIIQDSDGSVRVWDTDSPEYCNELFFGKEDHYICEKIGNDTYVEVVM